MTGLTRAATAAALTLALALPLGVAGPAGASAPATPSPTAAVPAERPELPRPTGARPVGSTVLHLVDRSRTDPWTPGADGRELMVTLHYPASRAGGGGPAPYATTEETAALVKGLKIDAAVPAERLSAMRTHSRANARPARGKRPLVVLSPGFSVSRYTQTHLAEDLASRGYVVASVDHAYESYGIAAPDGRLLGCTACTALESGAKPPSLVTSTRAKDVSFLLDRLTGPRPAWKHSRMIDAERIGMAGHSIGGASAASAMAGDPRVLAGVNMDGAFWEDLPSGGLGGRPFMMLGTDDEVHRPGGLDTSWDRTWPALGGWKRWLTIAGSEHFTFSDQPVIAAHFGLPQPALPAPRAVALTRAHVAAFFDLHLRGLPQPLLDGPSADRPEVVFHHP